MAVGDVVDDGPDDAGAMIDKACAPLHNPIHRTDNTKGLKCFTTPFPHMLWEEVVHDYQLGAIVDFSVGDGSLALTAARNQITYTGFAFTACHKNNSHCSLD